MELNERPKLTLKKTPLEFIFDGVTVVLFMVSVMYLLSQWSSLPAKVPTHYNAVGDVTRWGSKWGMLTTPIIAIVMWISMTVLEKYPHVYNYLRLTKENVRAQYVNARQMVNVLKNIITLVFAYVMWKDTQVALHYDEAIGVWFLPVFFIVVFGPMIYFIIRSFRI